MGSKTEKIELRVTKEEKKFIKKKANEVGFKSVTAFLMSSAEDFFKIDLDISHFREVAKEINYIGQNINNLVHHIFATNYYTDYDLKEIKRLQEETYKRIDKEYDYLLKLEKKYNESNMNLKDKERLIKELKNKKIKVPKELLFNEIYEQIQNNILYISTLIENSPEQEEGISDYVYEYFFDGVFFDLDEDDLIKFADEIYIFAERMKFKMLNINNFFDDDDWWDLKNILDKYEDIY